MSSSHSFLRACRLAVAILLLLLFSGCEAVEDRIALWEHEQRVADLFHNLSSENPQADILGALALWQGTGAMQAQGDARKGSEDRMRSFSQWLKKGGFGTKVGSCEVVGAELVEEEGRATKVGLVTITCDGETNTVRVVPRERLEWAKKKRRRPRI